MNLGLPEIIIVILIIVVLFGVTWAIRNKRMAKPSSGNQVNNPQGDKRL